MSVAFDAVATTTVTAGNSTTVSLTHTPVGTPTAVGMFIFNYEPGAAVTGVTYGGTSMALQEIINVPGASSTNSSLQIWGLANPTSGAQTVTITLDILIPSAVYLVAASETVTGSDTSTCFRASSSAVTSGATTSLSTNVSASSGDLVADITGYNNTIGSPTATAGGGQTAQWGPVATAGNIAYGSTQFATGTTSMSWTWTQTTSAGVRQFGIAAAAFQAAPALQNPFIPKVEQPYPYPRYIVDLRDWSKSSFTALFNLTNPKPLSNYDYPNPLVKIPTVDLRTWINNNIQYFPAASSGNPFQNVFTSIPRGNLPFMDTQTFMNSGLSLSQAPVFILMPQIWM